MAETNENAEIAEAIRELAHQVDTLGNAVVSAAHIIAKAIAKATEASLMRP
jgi:hypothetical protein